MKKRSSELDEQASLLRARIRAEARTRNITYTSIARSLQVSYPSIKRWMSQKAPNFGKLALIANSLGLALQAAGAAEEFAGLEFTSEQENYFACDLRRYYFFLGLQRGLSFCQASLSAGLGPEENWQIISDLDKLNLARLMPEDRIALTRPSPTIIRVNGKLEKELLASLLTRAAGPIGGETVDRPCQCVFQLSLSKGKLDAFQIELERLLARFRQVSALEQEDYSNSEQIEGLFLIVKSGASSKKDTESFAKALP